MIDALDHAAQERGNRSAGAWLLVALLGIALSVAAGMMSYGYMTAQTERGDAEPFLRCIQQRLYDQKPDSRYGDRRRGCPRYGARRFGG